MDLAITMGERQVKISGKPLAEQWEADAGKRAAEAAEEIIAQSRWAYLTGPERLAAVEAMLERMPKTIAGAAAGAWTLPNGARTNLLNGTFDLDTDTFKIALFLSTSNIGASSTTYAAATNEHANGNGYTTGGNAATMGLSGTTTVTVSLSDVTWTSSGTITARFAVLYEVSGSILAYCLLDSTPADVSVASPNTLTVDNTNLLTLA